MDREWNGCESHQAVVAGALREGHSVATESAGSVSNQCAWFVVQTKARQERLAYDNLTRQGFHCYMPTISLEKVRRGKTTPVVEAMFPSYLFIQLDTSGTGQSWAPIRSTYGVIRLINFGGAPTRVDDALIELIRSHEQRRQQTPETLFRPGEKVVITQGPFAGFEALYQMVDAQQRCRVFIEMLCKSVSLTVDAGDLRSVTV